MRNVLLVTRNFAPTSHVSVERATKLAKYLPEFGWRPTVLTGTRSVAGLPSDPQLLEQVAGVEIIRTRAPEFSMFYETRAKGGGGSPGQRGTRRRGKLHPKAWLVPDSQLLWYPFAVRAAMRRAGTARWDAVIATSFPRRRSSSRTGSRPGWGFRTCPISAIRGPTSPMPRAGRRRWPNSSAGSRRG